MIRYLMKEFCIHKVTSILDKNTNSEESNPNNLSLPEF